MSRQGVIQSHVEVLMEKILGLDQLYVDERGQVPVHHRSALYTVRVVDRGKRAHVEVYSVAVDGVDADPGLYEALNALNGRLAHARAYWTPRKVVLAAELVGESVDETELEACCAEVSGTAHREGPRLAATFGGAVARPDHIEEGDPE